MRTQNNPFRLTATIAVAGLLLAQILPRQALAQPAPPPPAPSGVPANLQTGDPPARVGRLARITGTVSFHTQDETQWGPATLNYPVAAGDALWTQPSAQAEIEVSASRIVMAPTTELDVATLTDTAFQATLPQGEVYLNIQPAAPNETYAVQTPRGLVTLASPGRYAVNAGDTQNPSQITVVQGSAHVSGPGVELDVAANQTANISGTDTFQSAVGPAQPDAFLTAMLAQEQPPPQQGVAPPASVAAMPGGEDLSAYGTWTDTPDYGEVWYPQVASDWVPYREGYWAYVAPWGWTWVDSDPWGFAPFHYGRWAYVGSRWGWIPGGEVGVPVYAPALVTFIGVAAVGVGIGAALGGGRIGWVPLGPREPFHPWYHASDRYLQDVNRGHVTNFTAMNRNVTINSFANRNAVTVVPASALSGSRPVRGLAQRIDPAQLAQARPVIGAQPLRPAATTVGVTPAVARQLNLAPASNRAVAPGPAIHARPAFAGATTQHPAALPLRNPAAPATPAAGTHPFAATPALRAPAPGKAGPPPIHREPTLVGPGAAPHVTAPAVVAHPPAPAPHTLQPVHPALTPPPQFHAPAPPVVAHTPAPASVHAPPATAPQFHAPPAPAVVHAPPRPEPQFHAPPPAQPHPAPQFHAPPPPAQPHPAPAPPRPEPAQNAQHKKPGEP